MLDDLDGINLSEEQKTEWIACYLLCLPTAYLSLFDNQVSI